jgi:hypothetical protein
MTESMEEIEIVIGLKALQNAEPHQPLDCCNPAFTPSPPVRCAGAGSSRPVPLGPCLSRPTTAHRMEALGAEGALQPRPRLQNRIEGT